MWSLNRIWRGFGTYLSFFTFGLVSLVWTVLYPTLLLLPERRRQRVTRDLVRLWFQIFLRFMRGLGICTWDLRGVSQLGRPGQLIVANHPMFLDIMFLLAWVPNAGCIVKGSLRRNIVTRWGVISSNYVTNDSTEEMLQGAVSSLTRGEPFIIFPEGTRTVPDTEVVFQRGAAHIAIKGATVVTPVVLTCTPHTLTKGYPWYRIPPKKWHFTLSACEDIELQAFRAMGSAPIASRRLNEYLQNVMTRKLSTHE